MFSRNLGSAVAWLSGVALAVAHADAGAAEFIVKQGDRAYEAGTTRSGGLKIISELSLQNGNTLRFVDEASEGGAPRVGVVEVIAPKTGSVLRYLTETQQITPLELYLALAPRGAPVPTILSAHHKEAARTQAGISYQPRVVGVAFPLQGSDVGSCWAESGNIYHWGFLGDVTSAFGVALPNHGHGHDLTSTHYGITGISSKRALGTCNVNGYAKSVRIEYRYSSNLWITVPLGVTWLVPGQSLFYYSSSGVQVPQTYRIKVGLTTDGFAGNSSHTEGSW